MGNRGARCNVMVSRRHTVQFLGEVRILNARGTYLVSPFQNLGLERNQESGVQVSYDVT